MFKWPPGALETVERANALEVFGEALATFGEQLKMQGLGLTAKGPALLYDRHGEPIA